MTISTARCLRKRSIDTTRSYGNDTASANFDRLNVVVDSERPNRIRAHASCPTRARESTGNFLRNCNIVLGTSTDRPHTTSVRFFECCQYFTTRTITQSKVADDKMCKQSRRVPFVGWIELVAK